MRIENLSENYKLNINFSNNQPTASKKNNQRKNYALKTVAGVGIAGVAFVGAGLISRRNFTKNALKKELK